MSTYTLHPVHISPKRWVQPIPTLADIEWPEELIRDHLAGDEDAFAELKQWSEDLPPYLLTERGVIPFNPREHHPDLYFIFGVEP